MLVESLIAAEWERVVNWGNMRASSLDYDELAYTEADFDNFVEITFRRVAEELGVRYNLIKDVLYGRNIEFFELKTSTFEQYDSIELESEEYTELTAKLMVPCIYHLKKVNTVDTFFRYFSEMSLYDKIEVIDRLNGATIDIISGCQEGYLKQFNGMTQKEKCEIIKKMFGAQVTV